MNTRPSRLTSRSSCGRPSPADVLLTAAVLAALTAAAPAQRQFDELRKRGLPSDNDDTRATALGDVDGDGDLDIVFTSVRQDLLYLNLLRQVDAPLLPRIGRSYTLDAYARYGPASLADAALPFVSSATASIQLPPLGTLGIDPTRMLELPLILIPRASGVGSVSLTVPNVPGLVGVPLYAQAVLGRAPFQPLLTNVTADVILR